MAAKKAPSDFEDRYLDMFEGTVKSMDKKLDRMEDEIAVINKTAVQLNNKVNKLENAVFPNQAQTVKDLPKWYRDPNIIKLLLFVTSAIILFIYLVAALFGQQLPKLFGAF